jgi:PQQ-like domain/PQQ enzyme repeat
MKVMDVPSRILLNPGWLARLRRCQAFAKSVLLIALVFLLSVGEPVSGVAASSASPGPAKVVEGRLQSQQSPAANDWPQVQRDPQRTGYSPEILGTNFQVVWTHPFQPEKVFPQVQAIVYDGKVFVGTEMGNLYALNAATGAQIWKLTVGAPILNSVAAGWGKVYFGAMDGAVYAVDEITGVMVWRAKPSWRLGFSTAPLIADNKVMVGGRNGVFYAFNPNDGSILWQYNVGAPILQTAAWDNGRAYFGAMDMRVYAVNTSNGSLAWQSAQLAGIALKDYWPVAVGGNVVVQPMADNALRNGIVPGTPFGLYTSPTDWQWLAANGPAIAQGKLSGLPAAMNAQQAVLTSYASNPGNFDKTMDVLGEATGTESAVVPHFSVQTHSGATTPPCVDRDGLLIVPVMFVRSGWGRLNLSTQRISDILYDNKNTSGGAMSAGDTPAGMGNYDEDLNVTCTGNLVLGFHTEEYNANYTGAFDLNRRLWIHINPGQTNRQMSSNTQGGGGNPPSVSNAMIYHISLYELIARRAGP